MTEQIDESINFGLTTGRVESTLDFGSDPLPAEQGDNLNNPIDLGDFSSIFKSFEIKIHMVD